MTKESLATLLNGREYGSEITSDEEARAKSAGLVVVFAYSDDNVELRGAIRDEVGAYDGGTVLIADGKVFDADHECECDYCGFDAIKKRARKIEACWDGDPEWTWTYKTDIPHATFEIMEDGTKFCRGIVFAIADTR